MNANLIWSLILGAIGIWGIYLAGSKNIFGWMLGLFAQVLWFIFALVTGQYGFILTAVAYGAVYARNYIKQSRERKALKSNIEKQAESRIYG